MLKVIQFKHLDRVYTSTPCYLCQNLTSKAIRRTLFSLTGQYSVVSPININRVSPQTKNVHSLLQHRCKTAKGSPNSDVLYIERRFSSTMVRVRNEKYKSKNQQEYHSYLNTSHRKALLDRLLCNNAEKSATRTLATKSTSHQIPNPYDAEFIHMNTEISTEHLTPEIKLHLITPNCPLWKSKEGECPVPDPFWAFYWPGGQALTRYIMDHPWFVQGKTVLDVGSGCGASAIASVLSGASHVLANDICGVAASAIAMNAKLNNIAISVSTDNLIGQLSSEWDVVLLGDMFYDDDFTEILGKWIYSLKDSNKTVVVGDPGRIPFMQHPVKRKLELIAMYDLPPQAMQENSGMTAGYVWACK